MTEQAPPEAIEAMIALVRRLAKGFHLHGVNETGMFESEAVAEAYRIAALLPKPVDEAVLACREILASFSHKGSYISVSAGEATARLLREGKQDDSSVMAVALAAYAAGAASTKGRG